MSALIDKGELDAARATLRDGREVARVLRKEFSRSEAGFLVDEARIDRLQLNHDAAREKFAEAARLDPDDCWIWIDLGDLWTLLGSLGEAEKAFRMALKAAIEKETIATSRCRRRRSATCSLNKATCQRP